MHSNRELQLTEDRPLLDVARELVDSALVAVLLLALAAYHDGVIDPKYVVLGFLSLVLALWMFSTVGLYRSGHGERAWAYFPRLVLGWLGTVAFLLVLGLMSGTTTHYSAVVVMSWIVAVPAVLGPTQVLWRALLETMWARGIGIRTAVVAGTGPQAQALVERFQRASSSGIRVLGSFSDEEGVTLAGVSQLGPTSELSSFVKAQNVELVYLAMPSHQASRTHSLITALGDTTASVFFVPDLGLPELTRVAVKSIGGVPAVVVCETPFANAYNRMLKRLSDLVFASLLVTAAAIPMCLIALAVRISSPGPVIFRQRRYGLNGQKIVVYKFRTMTVAEDGPCVEAACRIDPRVTPVGRILRRMSLDELPQLVNVLQGRMSLVGPRPLCVAQNEAFRTVISGYMIRHKVKPGITGWAQVNGLRGGDSLDRVRRRVDFDLHYVRNWSPWLDLKIIARTVLVVFRDESAY